MVLKSNENMFVQTLKSCCDKKVKFNFVTVPDDEDMGTADSLRLLKDIIKVMGNIQVLFVKLSISCNFLWTW